MRLACAVLGWTAMALCAGCLLLTIGETGDVRDGGLIAAGGFALVGLPLLVIWRRLRRRDRRPEQAWGAPTAGGARPPADPSPVAGPRDGVLELRPSRRRWGLLLLLGLAFDAIGLAMVRSGEGTGWFVLLFFGACTAVVAAHLVPGAAWLRLSPQGLEWRSLWRRRRFRWDDVERFHVFVTHHRHGSQEHVGFDLTELTPERQSVWQTLGRGMTGADHALPDTYGRDADELAALLQGWRDRHARRRGPSPSALADAELLRAAEAVDRSRVPVVTGALVAVCVVAYVAEVVRFDLVPSAAELERFGGASANVVGQGRLWTLLAANVLHAGPVHLLLDLAALLVLGVLLERELGWARMLLVVLAGGVLGTGLSVLLHSGAVTFGVSAVVLAVAAYAVRRDLHRTRSLGAVAWGVLPLGVLATSFAPGASVGGHLGGLLAGLLVHLVLERGDTAPRAAPRLRPEATTPSTGRSRRA